MRGMKTVGEARALVAVISACGVCVRLLAPPYRLQYCKVTDEGCAALVSAMRLNPSHLQVLDLSGNYQIRTECKLLFDLKTDKHFRLQEIRL
ncbi:hypothetical protein SRHO_G00008780 [Serrasalmus rhombeus]